MVVGVNLFIAIAIFMCVVVHSRGPRRARTETKAVAPAVDAVVIVIKRPFKGAEKLLVLEILGREGLVQAREGRVVGRNDGFPL